MSEKPKLDLSDAVLLVSPTLLVLMFVLDFISQIVAAGRFSYHPQDWLLGIVSSTIAASLTQYFQKEYMKKLEKRGDEETKACKSISETSASE